MGDSLQIPFNVFLGLLQVLAVLIGFSIYLFISRKKAQKQHQNQPKQSRTPTTNASPTPLIFLKKELSATRQRYIKQGNAPKINLNPDAEITTQTTALRYIFLHAEIKRLMIANKTTQQQWKQTDNHLQRIILSYLKLEQTPESDAKEAEDLGALQQKIALLESQCHNLERYKQLFFDLQTQAKTSELETHDMHQEIKTLLETAEEGCCEDAMKIFNHYQASVQDVYQSIYANDPGADSAEEETQQTTEFTHKYKLMEQFGKLKKIAVGQKQTIRGLQDKVSELKQKLRNTGGSDPSMARKLDALIQELKQFEQNLKDSDLCVQVLESDNDSLQNDLHKLENINAQLTAKLHEQQAHIDHLINQAEQTPLDLGEVKVEELQNALNDKEMLIQQLKDRIVTLENQAGDISALMGTQEDEDAFEEEEEDEEDDDDDDLGLEFDSDLELELTNSDIPNHSEPIADDTTPSNNDTIVENDSMNEENEDQPIEEDHQHSTES